MSSQDLTMITPVALREWYNDGSEIAVLDVREEADFAEKHIFFAVCLPFGEIELRVADLLPRREVRIVLTDGSGELVCRAADRLRSLGYTRIILLAGGVASWEQEGLPCYSGVHVPSKAFAELVEERLHTPSIDVSELRRHQEDGESLVVLDTRTHEEFSRASIPNAYCVPGAELLRHARDLAPDPRTLVVVNCGGRTRSIIGAQTLISAGLPNRVVSLRDGLLAWRLHGLVPTEGADRRPPPPSPVSLAWGTDAARHIAGVCAIRQVEQAEVQAWRDEGHHTVYLLDVRSQSEFEDGHLLGAVPAPGGQLVQETDSYVAVHNAHVVLLDRADMIRARVTAAWLVQLGLQHVYTLNMDGCDTALEKGSGRIGMLNGDPNERGIAPSTLAQALAAGEVCVIDLAPGVQHRRAHVPGAWLARRTDLADHLGECPAGQRIVLTSEDGHLARITAREIGSRATWLDGGTGAWLALGYPTESGSGKSIGTGGRDVWLSPTQQPDIQKAARDYLAWELSLAMAVEADPDVRFALFPLFAKESA